MSTNEKAGPLSAKARSSYQKLLTAATELNSASDRFAKLVAEIDAALKPLNIGIICWVKMGDGWGGLQSEGYEQVGYAKVNGKWGIALSTVECFYDEREDEWETWAFTDAPRRLRLKAVDYLPNLLEELAKQAVGETKNIATRTNDLQQLVSALKDGSPK